MKKPRNPKSQRLQNQHLSEDEVQEIIGELSESDGNDSSAVKARLQELNKENLLEIAVTATQAIFHSGPLPPAEELRSYNDVCPGAADRIMIMAEKEQSFRHDMVAVSEERTYNDRKIGYFLGAGLLALLIGSAVMALYWNYESAAYVFLGTAVISVIGKFIPAALSKKSQK